MTNEKPRSVTPEKIRVDFLKRVEGIPASEWPVDRTEDMAYEDYLDLDAADLANTKAHILDENGNEINS